METEVLFPKIESKMAYFGDTKLDLANYLGITRNSLYQRLNGNVNWKLPELQKLCIRYKCSLEELV